VTCEDSYLILSLLQRADPRFSYAATAVQDVSAVARSNYDNDPRRFEDELTVQLRLHGGNLPRPGLAAFDDGLARFWETRPAAVDAAFARIPAELLDLVADLRKDFRVATSAQPWAYAAQLASASSGRVGPGFFRIECQVSSGPIGVGVLNPAGTDFLIRTPLRASSELQTVFLPVDDIGRMGRFVVQNWDMPGAHAVHLRSVSLWTVAAPRRKK
jgi:hypothetical protein